MSVGALHVDSMDCFFSTTFSFGSQSVNGRSAHFIGYLTL